MMKDAVSVLRFHTYSVDEMIYRRNYEFFSSEQEIELDFHLEAKAILSDGNDKSIIILTCKIFSDDFEKNNAPFYLKTTVRGFFTCSEGVNIEDFQFHGMAILLPYVRSIITSFTAQSGINPVILPPINVYKVFGKSETE